MTVFIASEVTWSMQFDCVKSVPDVSEVENIRPLQATCHDVCLTVIGSAFTQIEFGPSGRSSHLRGSHVGYDLSHFNLGFSFFESRSQKIKSRGYD